MNSAWSSSSADGSRSVSSTTQNQLALLDDVFTDTKKDYEDDTPLPPAHASNFSTILNLANGVEGQGILALPLVVKSAGWLPALLFVVGVAISSGYTATVLIACLYDPVRRTGQDYTVGASLLRTGEARTWVRVRSSYAEVGKAAFGRPGQFAVLAFQVVALIGVAALFQILAGASARQFALSLAAPGSLVAQAKPWLWTLGSMVLVIPMTCFPSLRSISWLSGFGVLSLMLVIGAVVGTAGAAQGEWTAPPPTTSLADIPIAYGLIAFSFSAHSMMPAMEGGMAPSQRRKWPMVVVVTFTLCALLKAIFMTAGWLAFAGNTTGVCTDQIPNVPLRLTTAAAIGLNTLLTLPLVYHACTFVTTKLLESTRVARDAAAAAGLIDVMGADGDGDDGDSVGGDGDRGSGYIQVDDGERRPSSRDLRSNARSCCSSPCLRKWGVRLAPPLLAGALGVAIPDFAAVMAWLGWIASPMITFIMPALFHLRLRSRQRALSWPAAFADVLAILFGVSGGVAAFIKVGLASTPHSGNNAAGNGTDFGNGTFG